MSSDATTNGSELPRLLGPWSAASIIIGSIIGSGIFIKPRAVAESLPSPGWILVCWMVAGLLALAGSLVFAELGSTMPRAGGQYVYLRESLGRFPAFLFGWTTLLIVNSASIAALAVISAEFLFNVLPSGLRPETGSHWFKTVPVVLILALVGANVAGLRWGAAVQNTFTVLKLIAVGALIAVLFVPGRVEYGNLSPFWGLHGSPAGGAGLWVGIKGAFLAIFWAYDGWYLLSFSGGEIRDPRRNIPRGFIAGMLVIIIVYVLANIGVLCAIDLESMKGVTRSGGVAAEAAERVYGSVGLALISIGIMGSTFGAANGNLLTGPRLAFAMARDGAFFRPLGAIHRRFSTPYVAIMLQGTLGAIYVFVGTFDDLTDSVVFAAWTFYLLTIIGYFRIHRRNRGRDDIFVAPLYPLLPAVFVVVSVAFLAYSLWDSITGVSRFIDNPSDPAARSGIFPLVVTAMIVCGVPVYLWFLRKRRRARHG